MDLPEVAANKTLRGHSVGNLWFDKSANLSVVYPNFACVGIIGPVKPEHWVRGADSLFIAPVFRAPSTKGFISMSVHSEHTIAFTADKMPSAIHWIFCSRNISAKESICCSKRFIHKLFACNRINLFLQLSLCMKRLFTCAVLRDNQRDKQLRAAAKLASPQ